MYKQSWGTSPAPLAPHRRILDWTGASAAAARDRHATLPHRADPRANGSLAHDGCGVARPSETVMRCINPVPRTQRQRTEQGHLPPHIESCDHPENRKKKTHSSTCPPNIFADLQSPPKKISACRQRQDRAKKKPFPVKKKKKKELTTKSAMVPVISLGGPP